MRIVKKDKEMSVKMVDNPDVLKILLDPTRWQILQALAKTPSYPGELAKQLKLAEQKVYYHIKELQKIGAIGVVKTKEIQGGVAKFFGVTDEAFGIVLHKHWRKSKVSMEVPSFLEPFFKDGCFDGIIVVGSPDQHGKFQARARDTHLSADLGFFLGSMSSEVKPCVMLDTQIRNDHLESNNLVLLGGPLVNTVTAKVNSKLPVQLKSGDVWTVYSKKSKKNYRDKTGLIAKSKSPWNPKKQVLVVAGNSGSGTRAAVLALTTMYSQFSDPLAVVVEGIDMDGDGVIDKAKILEK